ncbi:MAG: hypothetical protein KC731_11935 [Myxococcales bacterium]|nr:hypothetical protein [Myxococcales bacterium]
MVRRFGAAVALVLVTGTTHAAAQTSMLWGDKGELWSPASRLPDFSHAGYHGGARAIPEPPVIVDVRDFGAVGDGAADDGPALQAAIDAAALQVSAASPGAVWIPAGSYRVGSVLSVTSSGVVLRGDGEATELVFDVSLADLFGPSATWSYSGGLLRFDGSGPSTDVTTVVAEAVRGEQSLVVATTDGLAVGDRVVLHLEDQGDSLGTHLHAEQREPGTCSYQIPLTLDWPVRIEEIDGTTVTLEQPLRTDVRTAWSPSLRSHAFLEEVGVERLRIRFPDVAYAGHLEEPGYNALLFTGGVANGWVDDVVVVNADNGVITEALTKQITVRRLRSEGRKGHHGANVALSADVLFEDFALDSPFIHDLTLDHRSNGIVFSRGGGNHTLNLDHHRDSPFENLFTELGPFNYSVGGNACAGSPVGARTTYYNLAPPMDTPLLWGDVQTHVIGALLAEEDTLTDGAEWYEHLPHPDPPNLYEAQLAARFCSGPVDACTRDGWDVDTQSCRRVARADGLPCDDGLADTEGDACDAGLCVGTTPAPSPDNDAADTGCSCRLGGPARRGAEAWWLLGLVALSAGGRRRARRSRSGRSGSAAAPGSGGAGRPGSRASWRSPCGSPRSPRRASWGRSRRSR